MASILARNGFYHAQYTDKNGKLHRRSTKIPVPAESKNKANKKGKKYLTQAEKHALKIAQTWEQEAKGTMKTQEAQAYLQAAARMVEESSPIAREWLSEYQPRGGRQNQANAKHAVALFVDFLERSDNPNIRLGEITQEHCKSFLGEQLSDNNLTCGTVTSYKNHLGRAFRVAIEKGTLHTLNPFTLFKMSDVILEYAPERSESSDKTIRKAFTLEEMRLLLTKLNEPLRTVCHISFSCFGQRLSDCLNLKWSQIDFDNNTISFVTQKTKKRLELPLAPSLKARLLARQQQSEALNSIYVFPELVRQASKSKGAISTQFIAQMEAIGIKADREQLFARGKRRSLATRSFHSIRACVVTQLRLGNISADLALDCVGHNSEEVQRGYFKPSLQDKWGALSVLTNAVDDIL